jgi:hypothetical protein
VAYVLVMTPEVRAWLHGLRKRDRASAIQVGQAIGMLLEAGPELGRPLADRVRHSRLSNLKELRPGSAGRSEIRILYIFDPGGTRFCWWLEMRLANGRPGTARRSRWPRSVTRTT